MIESDVIERIKFLLKFMNWSPYRLAKNSNIPYSSLNNLLNRKTCPSIPTLQKICGGFNISLSEFFEFTDNPLRNEQLTETQQDIINAYESLSVKDKGLLLAYLQGLCKK